MMDQVRAVVAVASRVRATAPFLVALLAAIASGTVSAASSTGSLTINVTPNPIGTGDAVLVYGQLNATGPGSRKIVLHVRVNPASAFTIVQTGDTDAEGFYKFTEGAVETNRSWFVTAPGGVRSPIVHERVASGVTLAASGAVGQSGTPITFTGQVDPPGVHLGQQVILQKLVGDTGTTWKTIGQATVGPGSKFSIARGFVVPGAVELRVLLGGDNRNISATSDPVTVAVEQAQTPDFTIATSSPVIDAGATVTLSGQLFVPGSTSAPLAATSLTLWGRMHGRSYAAVASTTTGPDGSYSFTQTPSQNQTYEVRTTGKPPGRRSTAQLFEGVRDVATITAAETEANVGSSVTFAGTISPDKGGHVVYLERLGNDGAFHVVAMGYVTNSSTYEFSYTFGSGGTKTFRVHITGGTTNVGAVSPTTTITVDVPPLSALPTA
jgi:hypothetical protein